MAFNTDAIVLKITRTGEADRLITFLTKEKGIYKAFAKSAEKPKHRLHMTTNMFCYGNFTFFEFSNSSKVTEAELTESFFGLQSDIMSLALAQYFNELMIAAAPVETDSEEYLRLLLNSLYFLAEGKRNRETLKSIFELRLASTMGYMPSLISCAKCGEFETYPMYFNENTGELFCKNCRMPGSTAYPLEVISAMRHIVYSDLKKLFTLKVNERNIPALNYATEKYILSNIQYKFKSLEFYKKMAGS